MAISDKETATWREPDLRALCDAHEPETQRLEFKQQLAFRTESEKSEVEKDVLGMANAGGGWIIYGITERMTDDGVRAADDLLPLTEWPLVENISRGLNDRPEPRVSFVLHTIPAVAGGFYLVVEVVAAGRQPHMTSDGRYWLRRGTQVARMRDHEVDEEHVARYRRRYALPLPTSPDEDQTDTATVLVNVGERITHLESEELERYERETGVGHPPAWLSVTMSAAAPTPDMLDFGQVRSTDLNEIRTTFRYPDAPLAHLQLTTGASRYTGRIPQSGDVAARYVLDVWNDGVMHFGHILRRDYSTTETAARTIATTSAVHYIHDYTVLFCAFFERFGYLGSAAVQVRFDHVEGYILGLRGPTWETPLIREDEVTGERWRGTASELREQAPLIARDAVDRLMRAAGFPDGAAMMIDADGNLL